ncbi:MAG TPA: phosphotransferase [Candidatus Limnocylindrales bacterium]|nr:phosphotransferase [Candidatus Limnocylindrales bacterium]
MIERVGAVLTRPEVDEATAAAILSSIWGVEGELRPLPGERDRNFAVRIDGADAYVLKIANRAEDPAFLDLQHSALGILAAAGVPCQRAMAALDGRTVATWSPPASAGPSPVRLLTWLPGVPLADVPPASRERALLEDLGATMGRTARALSRFDHPAASRAFHWDARRGLDVIDAHAAAVRDPERAALLRRWRVRLEPLRRVLPTLRESVIHNDANDHNVLVAADRRRISGLLDLGDAIRSVTVNELAVAAAYAALDAPDPFAAIAAVRAGFERELPLRADEVAAVDDLVALRLCTSVALSAHQSALAPDDPYLTISEAPAWGLLERLAGGRAA